MPSTQPDKGTDLARIPHWARVAFAARCARTVAPLFRRCWPSAEPARYVAVAEAIRLAELSAGQARPTEGLDTAMLDALAVASAALASAYGLTMTEPAPIDEDAAAIASFVAKAAEHAASAARATPSQSVELAFNAYGFAQDAILDAGTMALLESLDHQFESLRRVVERGEWNDETGVPVEVFEVL